MVEVVPLARAEISLAAAGKLAVAGNLEIRGDEPEK